MQKRIYLLAYPKNEDWKQKVETEKNAVAESTMKCKDYKRSKKQRVN